MGLTRSLDDDPLTLALQPPEDETPAERSLREHYEAEARRISDEIDEQIRREREAEKKKRRPVKLLLLGQSESGKTATLKNFQLTYAKKEWMEERASWRVVIFLNLVRNVNHILDQLAEEIARSNSQHGHSTGSEESSEEGHGASSSSRRRSKTPLRFKEKHRILSLRLGPLRGVQADLEQRLGAETTELYSTDVTTAAPFGSFQRKALQEFSINSTNGWKSALDKFRPNRWAQEGGTPTRRQRDADDNAAIEVVASCREDMKSLWEDTTIREMLSSRKSRPLEDSPGFFLADVERIACHSYQPSDDDIIRARLRTLGVQEYNFVFEHGHTVGQEWRLFDVGGTRSSRAAWYPYFEDVDAIIFLAPISCFNEKLAEDRKVNRLEDSYLLWRSVQSCKLLAKTQMILFLNKCDLLQQKLQRGVRIRDSVPSFGDRRNDLPTATRYFQQHFREIQRQYSPVQRPFYVHLTSVIDTRSTAATLGAVEESILRNHLRRADLM
ncbi:guanine nucleotide binding protein, alpha subunit [Flagelloscypha sp. PMI_526]|nr:guanine nucleotide binding protein, alpha subunit [Flagelloscypha sp. PMI_526]